MWVEFGPSVQCEVSGGVPCHNANPKALPAGGQWLWPEVLFGGVPPWHEHCMGLGDNITKASRTYRAQAGNKSRWRCGWCGDTGLGPKAVHGALAGLEMACATTGPWCGSGAGSEAQAGTWLTLIDIN